VVKQLQLFQLLLQTTGADAVIAPFGRLNLEAATAAAEAVKPTPTLIDKAVTYAIEKPVPTIFGLSSLAALSAAKRR
jgi:hypothetical protein